MLTWLNRTTLHQILADTKAWLTWNTVRALWAHELVRLSARAMLVIMGLTLGTILLAHLIPPTFHRLLSTYVPVLAISVVPWMANPKVRLWIVLLLGTTVWALGMLVLTWGFLLECGGS